MAGYLATNEQAGTGAIMTVNISFKGNSPDVGSGSTPYINVADVKALIVTPASATAGETSVVVGLTSIGPTTFRTTAVVPVGKILRIYRDTENEYGLVDFQALQTVSERDLDLMTRQILYVSMETKDASERAVESATYGNTLARQAVDSAANANTSANSAVVTANAARDTANSASITANAASNKSNTAIQTANSAATAAALAEQHASAVESRADDAATAAEVAQLAAQSAESQATYAVTVATGIDGKAQSALDAATGAEQTSNNAYIVATGIDNKAQTALDTVGGLVSTHERLILRRKKILNLPLKNPEWDWLVSVGRRPYAQGFALDEDAGKLLIMDGSTPTRVILMYNWPTGEFDRAFMLQTGNIVGEGLVIRQEGTQKFLYTRCSGDVLGKFDVTTYPANRSTLAPTSLTVGPGNTAIPCGLNLMERNGIWTISEIANGPLVSYRSRGKFARYDSNFNLIGTIDCGDLLMGVYAGSPGDTSVTKAQGVADTGQGLIASMGGQWVRGNPVTDYSQNGLRMFTYDGVLVGEGLCPADKFADIVQANWGFTPALIENEGIIVDRAGNIFTINMTSNNGVSTASDTHGFLITQEFCFDGVDFSPAVIPRKSAYASRASLTQTAAGPVLVDNFSGGVVTTLTQLLESFQKAGTQYWSSYTTGLPLTNFYGQAFPSSTLLEVTMLSATVYLVTESSRFVFQRYQVYQDAGVWKLLPWFYGDTVNSFGGGGLTITRTDGGPTINMDGPAGSIRQIIGKTGGSNRWRLAMGDSLAESGNDAGSNFAIASYNDVGGYKTSPLQITRATGETLLAGLTVYGPAKVGVYTLTTLPNAASFANYLILVSNANGGPKLCWSNGTNWRLINTNTVVS